MHHEREPFGKPAIRSVIFPDQAREVGHLG
jgi:hypothetical protein